MNTKTKFKVGDHIKVLPRYDSWAMGAYHDIVMDIIIEDDMTKYVLYNKDEKKTMTMDSNTIDNKQILDLEATWNEEIRKIIDEV